MTLPDIVIRKRSGKEVVDFSSYVENVTNTAIKNKQTNKQNKS